jgi:uncharacterized protein YqhQ
MNASDKKTKQKPKASVWVALCLMFILIGLLFGFVFVMLPTLHAK